MGRILTEMLLRKQMWLDRQTSFIPAKYDVDEKRIDFNSTPTELFNMAESMLIERSPLSLSKAEWYAYFASKRGPRRDSQPGEKGKSVKDRAQIHLAIHKDHIEDLQYQLDDLLGVRRHIAQINLFFEKRSANAYARRIQKLP